LRGESQEKGRLAALKLDNKSGRAGKEIRKEIFPSAAKA
jgi:hypothetical protein